MVPLNMPRNIFNKSETHIRQQLLFTAIRRQADLSIPEQVLMLHVLQSAIIDAYWPSSGYRNTDGDVVMGKFYLQDEDNLAYKMLGLERKFVVDLIDQVMNASIEEIKCRIQPSKTQPGKQRANPVQNSMMESSASG